MEWSREIEVEKNRVFYLFPRFHNYTSFGVTLRDEEKPSLNLTFDASTGEEKVMLRIFHPKYECNETRRFPFLPIPGEPTSLQGIYLEEVRWIRYIVSTFLLYVQQFLSAIL